MNAREKMTEARRLLMEVKNSGYWPFASPCPCSTEVKIKQGFYQAITGLENALFWHEQMFGKAKKDCMSAPCTTIEQVK